MYANPDELNRTWRNQVTAPDYAALLRELDDLGCRFEWRGESNAATFIAVCDGETVGRQDTGSHEDTRTVIHDVLNQAADAVEVLA